MEYLVTMGPLFVAIIAFCAVFSGLGLLFNMLLAPVKRDIEALKKGQKELSGKIDQLLQN